MQWYLQRLRANVGRRAPHASGARDQRRPWRGAAGHASRSAAAQPKTDPKATPKMDGWRVACALAARTWAGRWYRAGYGARWRLLVAVTLRRLSFGTISAPRG